MLKKIEIKTPIYENVQTGEITENKWETSDGRQFDSEHEADRYEFYECKIKHRGLNLPVQRTEIFDFTCVEDLTRFEDDYLYNSHVKKYDKNSLVYPNTYVMYQEADPDFIYDSELDVEDYYYNEPETHVHIITLDEYKSLMIRELEKLK